MSRMRRSVAVMSGERVACPWCAEQIMAEARVCRFCGRPVAVADEASPAGKESSGYGCLAVGILVVAVVALLIYLGVVGQYG